MSRPIIQNILQKFRFVPAREFLLGKTDEEAEVRRLPDQIQNDIQNFLPDLRYVRKMQYHSFVCNPEGIFIPMPGRPAEEGV